jgi:hypothetical protein
MNWRESFIKISDLELTAEYVDSGNLKVGDIVYTKEDLYDNDKNIKVRSNQPYKVVNTSKRYPGCFAIQTEKNIWWFFFDEKSFEGGGQYFYVKSGDQDQSDNTNTENKTENEPTTPEDKENDALSQFGEVPTMIAKNLLKTKTFRWVNFLDYATNQSLKNDFGSDVQKMQQHRDEIRQRISKALIFMAQYKYIANREDHTLYVTQYGYHKIFG